MGEEARNVGLLKEAYKLWHDSKGGSVEQWISHVAEDVTFGSIARGEAPLGFTRPRASVRPCATISTACSPSSR